MRTAAARRAAPFRGVADLQPWLQAAPGERLLVRGPRSRLDAAAASRAVRGGSATPFDGPPPLPFPDERFDACLVAGPVGGPADAAPGSEVLVLRVTRPR